MNDKNKAPTDPENPENDFNFNGVIRDVQIDDLVAIKPILENWLRDRNTGNPLPNEVSDVMASIEASTQGVNGRSYVVAVDNSGNVVGVMGMATPSEEMRPYVTTNNPIEFINAYVDPAQRGTGAGKALAAQLEQKALQAGRTEIIVNSGPRYRDTGWAFWTRLYGEPVATAEGLYGPGGDAAVWRKPLVATE